MDKGQDGALPAYTVLLELICYIGPPELRGPSRHPQKGSSGRAVSRVLGGNIEVGSTL